MAKRYLLGNEAIAHACIEAGVDFASGYPGTPSSEVIDTLRAQREREFYIEWSVNEKVAYENALAASWCGLRSIVTMKHVGLNVAADPLLTSAYTGVEGGFVVLSADDPYAHSSQNEQDTRRYAHFAKIPCMNPSSVQEAHDMMLDAFALSEEVGLPVIFRPTTRICHSKGDIDLGEVSGEHRAGAFVKDPRQYVVIPAHTRVLHKILNEKQPMVRKAVMNLGYNTAEVRGDMAVVASGIAASYVQEVIPDDVSFMKIGCFPIDGDWMQAFVQQHRVVLVVEEGKIPVFLLVVVENLVVYVVRLTQGFHMLHDALHLLFGDEGALHADRESVLRGGDQHVALAQELFRPYGVDDDARVELAGHHESDAAGDVRLDEPRNHVDAGALSGKDEVNAHGAAHGRQARQGALQFLARGCHEVGELVDHDHDIGQAFGRESFFLDAVVVALDVPYAHAVQEAVAALHLAYAVLQRLEGALRLRDDRRKKVGDAVVELEFHDFGVDEQ